MTPIRKSAFSRAPLRLCAPLMLGLTVSACANIPPAPYETLPAGTVAGDAAVTSSAVALADTSVPAAGDVVTSAAPGIALTDTPSAAPSAVTGNVTGTLAAPYNVTSVVVDVPRSLVVSEANLYYPGGDIVWREDPPGDRYAQVQKIFEDAMTRGVQAVDGPQDAVLNITVKRFHSLTQKARYVTGGVHSITFDMSLTDPETGAVLVPAREIKANLKAYGGNKAIQADARGETQKVRISNHLAGVIQQELTVPNG